MSQTITMTYVLIFPFLLTILTLVSGISYVQIFLLFIQMIYNID